MSESDSLWHAQLSEDDLLSIREDFATIVYLEFLEGRRTQEDFDKALDSLLPRSHPRTEKLLRRFLRNYQKPRPMKRSRPKSLVAVNHQIVLLAILLRDEKPNALRKGIEEEVWRWMRAADPNGVVVANKSTVFEALRPYFKANPIRRKK